MAVHKIPQDVEADDKFLGPLSFKQFLFFGGMAICGYLTFLTLTKIWPISFIFAIPTIFFGVLAFPWSKEQPTELFIASRIRFLIKPRRRIWDQSGLKDLITVTAPIREKHIYSDGLSQGEVRKRMSALATMVDSRGWAVKNVTQGIPDSDRLVVPTLAIPDENTAILNSTQDVFDEKNGTIAQQFDSMIEKSIQQHKTATLQLVEAARHSTTPGQPLKNTAKLTNNPNKAVDKNNQDFWFMHQQAPPTDPSLATFQAGPVITPGVTTTNQTQITSSTITTDLSEEELLKAAHEKQRRDAMQTMNRHERVIDPNGLTKKPVSPPVQNQAVSTMTPQPNPDILNLAQSNDLSVETLARQVNKKKNLGNDGEVVVSLH